MRKQIFLFFILCTLGSTWTALYAQQQKSDTVRRIAEVRVKVIDHETGYPIKGATITHSSKQQGTTDENGETVIKDVPDKAVAFIEAPGFVKESRVIKTNRFTIRLMRSSYQNLTGMIDFGYYSRHTDHVSSEAVLITGEEVRRFNGLDIFEVIAVYDPGFVATRGNYNGNDPNTPSQLQIRGSKNFPADASVATVTNPNSNGVQINPSSGDFIASHIAQPNLPLLLVDGMEVSPQQLADLNIHRIKSITLLKDAVAANAYGSRGGNGVIVVQTYPGRQGLYNLTYSGQLQVVNPDVSSYNLLPQADKIPLEEKAGIYNAGNQDIYNQRLARINSGELTNWQQRPLQTGVGSAHSLRFDGGNETISYGLNLFHNQMPGSMKSTGRTTTNLDANYGMTYRSFSLKTVLSYTKASGKNSTWGSWAEYNALNPYWYTYDQYGRVSKILEMPTAAGDTAFNPEYNSTIATKNESVYARLGSFTQLQLKLRNGFSINGRLSLYKVNEQVDIFYPAGHTMFAQYAPDVYFKRGLYNQTNSNFSSVEGNLNGDYRKQWGMHFLYATIGLNAMSTASESVLAQVQGFTSDQLSDIAFGTNYTTAAPTTGKINTRLISAYSNVAYSYGNRYQAELGFTRDGSSAFGTNNLYANYPSAAISWNAHNESFLSNLRWINKLKIKAGIGVSGSRFFPSYLSNTSYNYFTDQQYILGLSTSSTMGMGVGSYLINVGNTDIESPRFTTQNIGLDMVLFNSRLFIRANVYKEESRGLVLPEYAPGYTGFTAFSQYKNDGAINNKGFEFALSAVLIQNKNKEFRWSMGVNGLYNENTVQAISSYITHVNDLNNSSSKDQTRPQPLYVPGQPVHAIWAVQSLGLDKATGQEVFRTLDGDTTTTWSASHKIMAGSADPKWRGTFNSIVNYKRITVGFYVTARLGGYTYNQTLADKIENADINLNVDARAWHTNRWSSSNPNAPYKALSANGLLTNPTYATTRFVEKENVFSLSGISLAYAFKEPKKTNFPLQQTSVTGYFNNLFMMGGAEMERGINYPFARSFVLKLTTSFR